MYFPFQMNPTLLKFVLLSFWTAISTGVVFSFPAITPEHLDRPACVNSMAANIRPDCGPGDGRISLKHNGTAPFTYSWAHNAALNDSVAANLPAGSYPVTVSDGAGCTLTDTFVVALRRLTVAGNSLPDTCGMGLGVAEALVITGAIPFSYQWDAQAGGQTTSRVTGLRGGTYQVTVTDGTGCVSVQNLVVPSSTNNFNATVSVTPVSCLGRSDGLAVALATGGNGDYVYEWTLESSGAVLTTNDTLAAIPAGFYLLTVTDGQGGVCEVTRAVTVSAPDTIQPNIQVFATSSCNLNDGSALATPSNGTAPFSYLWSNGDTLALADSLAPGNYFLDVTDTNGCTSPRAFFVVTTGPGPTLSIDTLQADVCGLGQGIVRVRIAGGLGPFKINWDASAPQPADTAFAYNLRPQPLQRVFVTDAAGCFKVAFFDVPGNDSLVISSLTSTENYCNLADGTATVTLRGGVEPYSYVWTTNPPQTTATATGLPGGEFEVIVTDANFCQTRSTVTVENLVGYNLFTSSTNVRCYGDADGTARAVNFGGFFPLTFNWSTTPPREGAEISDLEPGTYTVTATDARGCERTNFVIISQPDSLKAMFVADPDTTGPIPLNLATVRFLNQSIGAEDYIWSFGTGDSSILSSPTYVFPDEGLFTVKLLAYNNDFGCVDSAKFGPIAVIEDGRLFVPAAFSPNSDGKNDLYQIKGINISEVEMRVYSRQGKEIFFTDTLDGTWDGNLPGGGSAPMGVYMYTLRVVFSDQQEQFRKGTITLIR
jgi:gliding motility-associated-like protein